MRILFGASLIGFAIGVIAGFLILARIDPESAVTGFSSGQVAVWVPFRYGCCFPVMKRGERRIPLFPECFYDL